ncbi:hypothetical protein BH09MYX1_BH09MYX1_01140 [soil metagenome]
MFCTGTLINPRLVVTASHCLNGTTSSAANGQPTGPVNVGAAVAVVGLDYTTPAPPLSSHRFSAILTAHSGIVSPNFPWDDFAVVLLQDYELANAYAFHPSLTLPASSSGGCPTGAMGCLAHYNQLIGILGYSPFAPLAPPTTRHIFQTAGFDLETTTNAGWVKYSFPVGTSSVVQAGDSGGPLWVEQPAPADQGGLAGQTYRDVFGVAAAVRTVVSSFDYASIVHTQNRDWLLNSVRYSTSGFAPAPHSSYWYTQHNKTDQMWIGDVDYIGACKNNGNSAACNDDPSGAHGVDCDCDHWYDHGATVHDNCPYDYNPDQADAFEFASNPERGDICRTCPFGDADRDGVCDPCHANDTACTTWFEQINRRPDNCVNVKNVSQLNANALAETSNGRTVLGDDCDPVPVPRPDVGTRETNVNCVVIPNSNGAKVCSSTVLEDDVTTTTIASHAKGGSISVPVNVTVNATSPRFCQRRQPDFDCASAAVINDAQVSFFPNAAAEAPDPAHPWHRVTTKWLAGFDPRGYAYPNWVYGATVSTLRWDFAGDLSFWLQTNPARIPGCTATSCLGGAFWMHSDTAVGRTVDTVSGILVGLHGADLSNAYDPIHPVNGLAYCTAPLVIPQETPEKNNAPKPKGLMLWPKGQLDLRFGRGEHNDNDYLMATSLNVLGVVGQNEGITSGTVSGQNCGGAPIDSAIQATTIAQSVHWLNAVESGSAAGSGPDAIALSADGTSLVMRATLSDTGMTGIGYDVAGAPGSPAPHPTDGHVAAYSRALGAVFVGGGTENGKPQPTLWTRSVVTPSSWVEITPSPGGAPGCSTCGDVTALGNLRALTYSYVDQKLWFIDEIDVSGTTKMRLARASMKGSIEPLAVWIATGKYVHYYLNNDRDGAMLVSFASNDPAFRVARVALDPTTGGVRVTHLEGKDGESLIAEPTVSSESYGFLLTSSGSVGYVTRVDSLTAIAPAALNESL